MSATDLAHHDDGDNGDDDDNDDDNDDGMLFIPRIF